MNVPLPVPKTADGRTAAELIRGTKQQSMKRSRLFLLTILALLTAGCIHDSSDCPVDDNFVMKFNLRSAAGEDIFDANIHKIDVLFFDAECKFVMRKHYTPGMLDAERGVAVTLDPGEYKIVCWANVQDNSGFCGFIEGATMFSDCYVEIPETTTTGGDKVYYSPYSTHPESRSGGALTRAGEDYSYYTVTIPARETVVKEYGFARAHRTVNVFVSGFDDSPEGVRIQPTVDARRMWSRYDFFFNTQHLKRDFCQQTARVTVESGEMDLAAFHSAYGEIADDMDLIVKRTSDGTDVATVNLKQFVADNPLADKSEINILVSFLDDHSVTITVPEWIEKPVVPGV